MKHLNLAILCLLTLCFTSACTKKIDGSSMDKFYLSSSAIMKTIPGEEKQMEFANGLELILFFAPTPEEAISDLNGKNADEIFARIQKLRDEMPRIDASRRERYASSLSDVMKSIPNDNSRQALQNYLVRYGFFPWNAKNEANIHSLDEKNAFEFNKVISDIRRTEDPTKIQ